MTWFLLYSFGLDNSHILYGTVHIVGDDALYLIHNLQALYDLAKDRILTIEVGCAALVHIRLADILWQSDALHRQTLLHTRELLGIEGATPDDVELCA